MLVQATHYRMEVWRTPGEPSVKSESAFWYKLKQHLNDCYGTDLIKRIMSKDGHLVGGDNYPYYLRDRKWNYCIHDPDYCFRELHKTYNSGERVRLSIERWSGDNYVTFDKPIKEEPWPCTDSH